MVAVELSKIVVVTINVIFLIFGLAALIVGIVFKVGWDDVRDAFIDIADDLNFDLQSAGDVLGYAGIIFGSFIIVVSFLGCVGACCKLRVLLVLYAIIVLLLIIGECAIVGIVATHASQTEETIETAMDKSLKGKYFENGTDSNSKEDKISRGYSALFNKLECCGIKNYTDSFPMDPTHTFNTGFHADTNKRRAAGISLDVIPIGCCKTFSYKDTPKQQTFIDQKPCLTNPTSDNAYMQGCVPTIIDKIKDNKGILIGVGVAILVLELLMVIIAFFLCCRADD